MERVEGNIDAHDRQLLQVEDRWATLTNEVGDAHQRGEVEEQRRQRCGEIVGSARSHVRGRGQEHLGLHRVDCCIV